MGGVAAAQLEQEVQRLEWLRTQAWLEFQQKILAVVNTNGWHHVKSAKCRMPLFDKIIGFYEVPVTDGPAGYADAYGREVWF